MHRQNVFTSGTDQRSSRCPGQDKGQNKLHPRFQTLGTASIASTEQSLQIQTPGHASSIPFSHPTTGFNPQQFFTPQELGANQFGLMHSPQFPNAVSSPVHAPGRCRNPCQNQSQRSHNNNRIPPLCQTAAKPSSQGHQLHHTFNSVPSASFQCPGGFNLPDPGLYRGLGISQHPGQMLCGSNQSLWQQRLPGPGLSTLRWTYRPNKNSSTPPRSAYQPYMTSYGRQGQSLSTPPLNHQGSFTLAQSSVQPGTEYAQLAGKASDTSSQYPNPVSDAQSTQSVCQSIPTSSQRTVTTSPSSVTTTSMTSSSMSSSCVMSQSDAASALGSVTSASGQTSLTPSSIQSHHSRKGHNLTNFQQAPVSKSAQKKASAMAFWLSRVKEWFPDRQTTTYFLPPQHFNRVQYGVDAVADETVLVPEVPSTQVNPGPGPLYPTASSQGQSSQTVAGTIWTQNQGPPAPLPRYQQNDLTDDAATEHVLACLRALSDKEDQIMMVISKLEFRKYLDRKSDPIHAADCRLFPRPDKIVGWKCDGECDLLIIHRQFGMIIGEIKSVGANMGCIPNLDNAVVKRVRKAVDQLNMAAKVLSHLISDISKTVPITRTLILPFITSAQLMQALAKDSLLQKEFCHCLDSPDLTLAVSRCLCKDCMPTMADLFLGNKSPATESRQKVAKTYKPFDVYKLSESSDEDETGEGSCESPAISQDDISSSDSDDSSETTASAGRWSQRGAIFSKLSSWWKEISSNNPRIKTTMTDCLYDQLLARFCGPATTVDIPTVTAPRLVLKKGFEPQCKVLRTRGQAVAETGLIMSTLALYPQQVDIINDKTLHNVHLCGPPGVGKTLLITLKAIQWLHQGHSVDLLILSPKTKAVSMVIKAQLQHILSTNPDRYSAQLRCHTYCKDIDSVKWDIAILNELSAFVQDDQLFIIIDETPRLTMELLEKMKAKIPLMSVWCAGTSKLSNRPRWMVEKMLTVPLRSPPSISREVAKSNEITVYPNVPPYSSLPFAHATDGPPVRRLTHKGEPCHHELSSPDKCEACGRAIAQQLNDLDVGKSAPDSLQYRDVLILCSSPHDEERNEDGEVTQEAMPMVKALRASGVPVKVVTKSSPDDDIEDLALAVTNTVVLSDIKLVVGLERRVVVGMKGLTYGRMDGMSRSIAHVIWIDDFPHH